MFYLYNISSAIKIFIQSKLIYFVVFKHTSNHEIDINVSQATYIIL